MKISDILSRRKSFSFEVFPPKTEEQIPDLMNTLDELYKMDPDFVSVTYGAGGSNKGTAYEIVKNIAAKDRTPLMHFTCIGNTKDEVDKYVDEFLEFGIENTLLMRGDLPKDWDGPGGDFEHATDLIEYINGRNPDLCILGAGYPETHIAAVSPESDIKFAKMKQDMGAKALTTQLCYDIEAYKRYKDALAKEGVTIPVIIGLMPVLRHDPCIKMTLANGCSIPSDLARILGKYSTPEQADDFLKAGKEYTAELFDRFTDAGAEGIHLFSLNRYEDVTEIVSNINLSQYRD